MYALVNSANNNRVIDINANIVPLPDPLFWIECPDTCKIGMFYINGEFVNYVPPPPVAMENKITAIKLLKDTDWATYSDVINTSIMPHLLNQDEFLEYRRLLRIISLDPVDGNMDWPVIPDEKWAK
jgi:hypothetical protein